MVETKNPIAIILAPKKEKLQPIKNEQKPVAESQLDKKVRKQTLRHFPLNPSINR